MWRTIRRANNMRKYTIVSLCLCGCEQTFIDVQAGKNATNAVAKVRKKRKQRGYDIRVLAIFEGSLKDISNGDKG